MVIALPIDSLSVSVIDSDNNLTTSLVMLSVNEIDSATSWGSRSSPPPPPPSSSSSSVASVNDNVSDSLIMVSLERLSVSDIVSESETILDFIVAILSVSAIDSDKWIPSRTKLVGSFWALYEFLI